MVSLPPKHLNETFKRRMAMLGKPATPYVAVDGDEPPPDFEKYKTPVPGPKINIKWTAKERATQEYLALLSEGMSLYKRNEYYRAIDAFTKAYDKSSDLEDRMVNINSILIDRADCYIQVGKPELAIEDVNIVLDTIPEYANPEKADPKKPPNPDLPRAILTKAEAYFSMGEFEFALVFFEQGLAIRKDMADFRDGVTKAKHAILDAIKGEKIFQPNPNYASSHTKSRSLRTRSPTKKQEETEENQEPKQEKQKKTARLLPQDVPPLDTTEGNENYLGELSLDFQFLNGLKAEISESTGPASQFGKKQNENIKDIVDDALEYLSTRGSFWCQQGKKSTGNDGDQTERAKTTREPHSRQRSTSPGSKSARAQSATRSNRAASRNKDATPHYEMSKLQQYESKYPPK
ncbi:TPR Domain containing protein [Trichomonas vaginalis G3]|uniref:Outer dynein arm-docking complex subunit 4 n=1 Tax=Trichomonas vaginalis (strain ATCC PRA-98 / G3) TaxID=412133 RepID=A2EC94_TRIV3|nr:cellular component assembly [Trichomonas vaginalis G3]EAY09771.1 TPR Domain containing protein [Trichomonas vaginalis G3]KAI5550934.1 cellular component assembly [Trichomonas vaginalis G3]|eukprot:XP_001321994.1 TPR Domain containing protein [Trichomonas vaginalis G3]